MSLGNSEWYDATARQAALYAELGSTGITRFGAQGRYGESVFEEKLRELQGRAGRELYRQMRLNHPVVAAVLYALSWALRSVSYRPLGASDRGLDREAVDFIAGCMEDMSFSWSDTLSFIVDPMLEQGFSLVEIVYKKRLGPNRAEAKSAYNDGLISWRKWAPRPATTLAAGREWQFDASGGVQGIWQEGPLPDLTPRFIPIERLLHFTTTRAPANNPEGVSVLRPMYQPWYYATNIAEIEAIGIERRLNGLPVMYLGRGASLDAGAHSDYTLAKKIVANIRQDAMAGVVLPGPKMGADGQGWLLELLSSTGNVGDTDPVLNRYHKLIALTALAQFIFLGMENVGTQALSKVQASFFQMGLNGWADNIADVISRHAIPRLLALNPRFAGLSELPRLTHSHVGVPDLAMLADFVNQMVGAAVLTPDENLEKFLRDVAGLPEKAGPAVVQGEGEETAGDLQTSEHFADIRSAPGNPTFERETNTYQRVLEEAYTAWYNRTSRAVQQAETEGEREEAIAVALSALSAQMVQLGREHLPRAVAVGVGNRAPAPWVWSALQERLAENERFIAESLIPALGQRLREAVADPDMAAGGETALRGVLQTFIGRVAMYANAFWFLLWQAYGQRVEEVSARRGQPTRVRWVLSGGSKHCSDCLALAKEYDSWGAMISATGGLLPGSPYLRDRGNCRCHLEHEVGGQWTRG